MSEEYQTVKYGSTMYNVLSQTDSRVMLLQEADTSEQYSTPFSVEVGLRRIMRFHVQPRRRWKHSHKPLTTRKNNAVVGWASSPLANSSHAYSTSLFNLVCALAGYGLKVDAVLEVATKQGWPQEIVQEARERAEETYQYLAEIEQGWPAWRPA